MIDELKEENDTLKRANETIERAIRKEMTENIMRDLQRKERATEERMQTRIKFLEKRFAEDVSTTLFPFEYLNKFIFTKKKNLQFTAGRFDRKIS